ncbi:MAG: hypothetical protein ABI831_25645 [Betaproteobacteria bacterium]
MTRSVHPHRATQFWTRIFGAFPGILLHALAFAALPPTSPGFPDPTYGAGGALAFGVRSGFENPNAIAPTPDGRWLISGVAQSAGLQDGIRYLARLRPDGRLDPTFGTQGFVIDNFSSTVLAVQPSGRILAAGVSSGGGLFSGALFRLNMDGTRDLTFGASDGQTVVDTANETTPRQDFESVFSDAQQRIVATSRKYNNGFTISQVEVWRFSADGIPDPAFGTQGHVSLEDAGQVAYNAVVRAQPDGKLVIAMWCLPTAVTSTRVCVVRLNPDGTRDTNFGPNGLRRIDPPGITEYPIYDLQIGADGKIYMGGTNFRSVPTTAVIFRLNADGTPDAGYGQDGIAKLVFSAATAYVFSVLLLPDGKQIAVGSVQQASNQSFGYVARLTANGQLDPTFGNAGISPTVSAQQHWFNDGVLLADGAILAIGRRYNTPGSNDDVDSLLARFVGVETTSSVLEFYNSILDHYFITADPTEAAAIDTGSAGPGWSRTGKTFKSGGPSRVCRLYGSPEIDPATGMRRGPNSHVYSIEAPECLAIRADPGWRFESYDFSGWLRLTLTCPAETTGVYRAYNNRFAQNDSNHRYTIDVAVYDAMLVLGWIGEGIVFCAPE